MIRSEPTTSILSTFWQGGNWPKGSKDMIFLGDALQRVGELKFRDDWTGKEIAAQRRVSSFPTFAGTLEYYWEKVRDKFPVETFPASSQTDWEGTIPPQFAIPMPISPADLKRLQRARAERLEQESADLRPIYKKFADEMEARKVANASSRIRLEWVINWIADHGRLGNLKTSLRLVRTENTPGAYIRAPEGIWNVEKVIKTRFKKGHINIINDDGMEEIYYIFFELNSLEQNLGNLIPFKKPAALPDFHLSPYMQSMIEAIGALNITPANQPKKAMLAAFLMETWRGPEPLPRKMAERMATVMRETNSQKGAYKHITDD